MDEDINTSTLRLLLCSNPLIDWRAVELNREQLLGLVVPAPIRPSEAQSLLAAYQRLVRILPPGEEECALPLLESGVHSAIQVAAVPLQQFVARWNELFPSKPELGLTVYRAAQRRRAVLLHHRMNELQQNEPHYRAARFK